jgi:aryl-alcohol dehydrogenase-like predicted oxidoreductase
MTNKIILGTVQFGLDYGINNARGKPQAEQVFQMLEYASANGICVIDTADAYGNATELLGEFNRNQPGKFEFNSKFITNHEPLVKQLFKSLKLLNINYFNVYFFHNFDDLTVYPNLLVELMALKRDKKIKKIGVSVYDNNAFKKAIDTKNIDVIQFPFNLLDNLYQRHTLIELAKMKNKELQARSVFLQGLFFKNPETVPSKLVPLCVYLEMIHAIAAKAEIPVEELALLYVIQQNEIDNVIIGVDSLEQLKQNLIIGAKSLDQNLMVEINRIVVKETQLLSPKNWS